MNRQDRQDAAQLAKAGDALDAIATLLAKTALGAPTDLAPGIRIGSSDRRNALFEFEAHQVHAAAIYQQVFSGDSLVGKLYCCKLKADGDIGDPILTITVLANGDVDFPDGEAMDIWPQNDPAYDKITRNLSYQLLKAIQSSLLKV